MSRENVEIAEAAIEAFNRGDWDAVFADSAPEFELDLSRAAGPYRGVHRLDQARSIVREFGDAWTSPRLEPHESIESDGQVIVPWTFRGLGRGGVEVVARVTWAFTVRDGAIVRMCLFQEHAEALAAAASSE